VMQRILNAPALEQLLVYILPHDQLE